MKKETIIGVIVAASFLGIISAITGIYGLVYIGIAFVIAALSMFLFSRKSVAAKTSAIILNTDLIYKILMPGKYKKAIKEIDRIKNKEKP